MTVYRVGPEGATIFSSDGKVLARLRPGQVVVPGYADQPGSTASQHEELMAKRIRSYPDKARSAGRDYADKAR